jgi:hypothetical protein
MPGFYWVMRREEAFILPYSTRMSLVVRYIIHVGTYLLVTLLVPGTVIELLPYLFYNISYRTYISVSIACTTGCSGMV